MPKVKHFLRQALHSVAFTVCLVATVLIGLKLALLIAHASVAYAMPGLPALLLATASMIGFIALVAMKGLMPYSQWLENLLRSPARL